MPRLNLDDTLFRPVWEIVNCFAILTISFWVPYLVVFLPNYTLSNDFIFEASVQIICDTVLIVDFILRFRYLGKANSKRKYEKNTGHNLVSVGSGVTYSYVRSWRFPYDAVSVLPVDLIAFWFGSSNMALWRIPRMLRLLRIGEHVQSIENWLVKRAHHVNANYKRTIIAFIVYFMLSHFCGVGFFWISREAARGGNDNCWVVVDGIVDIQANSTGYDAVVPNDLSPFFQYARSLYWAIVTMVTVGFGDIVSNTLAESLMSIVVIYIGMLMTGYIIGVLTNLVTNLDAAEDAHIKKMDALNRYMNYRRLPDEVRGRVRHYYQYIWETLRGMDEGSFSQKLPSSLKMLMWGSRTHDLLKKISFLRNINTAMMHTISFALEQKVFCPGDVIVDQEQFLTGTYFFVKGEAEKVSKKGAVVGTVSGKDGDVLGEASLMIDMNNDHKVVAKSYCELLYLAKDKFQLIAKKNCPEQLYTMKEKAKKLTKGGNKVNKFFGLEAPPEKQSFWYKQFLPDSKFRQTWSVVRFIALLYNIATVSFRVGFLFTDFSNLAQYLLLGLNTVVDTFFALDIYFAFRCFMFLEDGALVTHPQRIMNKYRESKGIYFDLLAVIPTDLLAFVFGMQSMPLLRLNKLFRVFRFQEYWHYIDVQIEKIPLLAGHATRRFIFLIFSILMASHGLGCIWHLSSEISVEYPEDIRPDKQLSWTELDSTSEQLALNYSMFMAYLRSVYWAIVATTTVGYGDIVPRNLLETLVASLIIFLGGLIYPAVVGALASLMLSLNAAKNEYDAKVQYLKEYMEFASFDKRLSESVLNYYNYMWDRQKGVDEEHILMDLPLPLRTEISSFLNQQIIEFIPFFNSAKISDGFRKAIVTVLEPQVYLPGDQIMHSHETGMQMYIIKYGAVRFCVGENDTKSTFSIMTEGDFWGEQFLVDPEEAEADVFALTFVDIFVLSRSQFNSVLLDFPHLEDNLVERIDNEVDRKNKQFQTIIANLGTKKYNSMAKTLLETKKIDTLDASSLAHPHSRKRRIWSLVILCAMLYQIFAIPLGCVFVLPLSVHFIDWIFDIFWIVDIYLNYTTFAYLKEGQIIHSKEEIKKHYRESGLLAGILSALPTDLLLLLYFFCTHSFSLATWEDSMEYPMAFSFFRINRLLRMKELKFLIHNVESLLKELQLMPQSFFKLFQLLFSVVWMSHLFSCVFLGFPLLEHGSAKESCLDKYDRANSTIVGHGMNDFAECMYADTWVQLQIESGHLPMDGGTDPLHYLRAINWAIPTLVVTVIGDVIPISNLETIYVLFAIVLGICVNAALIGNIAAMISNMEGKEFTYRQRQNDADRFLLLMNMPEDLRLRVRHHFDTVWKGTQGFDEESVLSDMPATLRMEVSNFLKLKFVRSCPFFDDFCDPALLKGIALKLQKQILSPGDVVLEEGENGESMYFLAKGVVELTVSDPDFDHGKSSCSIPTLPTITKRPLKNSRSIVLGKFKNASKRFLRLGASKNNMNESSKISPMGGSMANMKNSRNSSAIRSRNSRTSKQIAISRSIVARASGDFGQSHADFDLMGFASDGFHTMQTLNAGDHFGEEALFFDQPHIASAHVSDFSELFVLSKESLDELLMEYPARRDLMFKSVNSVFVSKVKRFEGIRKNLVSKTKNSKLAKLMQMDQQETNFVHKMPWTDVRSSFRVFWNFVCLIASVHIMIMTIYRASFEDMSKLLDFNVTSLLDMVLSLLGDLVFMIDVYLRLRKFSHFDEEHILIDDSIRISQHFYANGGRLDYFASIPYYLLAIPFASITGYWNVILFLRLTQLLRMHRIPMYLDNALEYLRRKQISINTHAQQFAKLFCILMLLNHYIACFWFIIHRFLERGEPTTWAIVDGLATFNQSYNEHNVMNDDTSSFKCYVRAVYFTIVTLSSVGYGDIRPYTTLETVFEIVVILTGACMFAGLIGSVAVSFQHRDKSGIVGFRDHVRKLRQYMKYRRLPPDLQDSILNHLNGNWRISKGVERQQALRDLPIPLQQEINVLFFRDVMRSSSVKGCCESMRKKIAMELSYQHLLKNEVLYHEGDIGYDIFFLVRGELESRRKDNKTSIRRLIKSPEMFGGDGFQSSGVRLTTVRSTRASRVASIKRSKLGRILNNHSSKQMTPQFREMKADRRKSITSLTADPEELLSRAADEEALQEGDFKSIRTRRTALAKRLGKGSVLRSFKQTHLNLRRNSIQSLASISTPNTPQARVPNMKYAKNRDRLQLDEEDEDAAVVNVDDGEDWLTMGLSSHVASGRPAPLTTAERPNKRRRSSAGLLKLEAIEKDVMSSHISGHMNTEQLRSTPSFKTPSSPSKPQDDLITFKFKRFGGLAKQRSSRMRGKSTSQTWNEHFGSR
eukprot:TRINITY_DN404_c0_g1_i4.p1 TRINITY_DN404_c0_g1~~TRINITY_DN404_c0_g1_i4.p1  ORF type:complete len:2361 (+),score=342.30 TRINITY_DN404_c0_g1_i4:1283-8365(+)